MALAICGCAESEEDIVEEFVEESGESFADCGANDSCGTAGRCLLDAFTSCRPSRGELEDGTYFIVPDDSPLGCHVIWFTSGGAGAFEKHKCDAFIDVGCAERGTCNIRNRWHL
jgi:hypothetical protein